MPKPKCNFELELNKATHEYGQELLDEMKDSFFSRDALIERVLLGLIPEELYASDTDLKRLATAKKALFGKGIETRVDAKDDQRVLFWMAQEHYWDKQGINGPGKPRSANLLATQASKRYPLHLRHAVQHRLRHKFVKHKKELMSAMGERQEAIGWLRRHALEDMKTILECFGVEFYSDN